ncbi:hypothetical protein GLYMA_09G086500v4 [Glycine max]|uniref:F-box associated domain-containing protein n=2 Tax=Glycine subgen. Soja TaxID=1462606 RepID=A0A0R0IES1_SOYBN|nr:hypothetical protein GLYMA_09G086500v4 [Glycine max]RZB91227.1 hypothetical protein D0Y65_023579 [Glycine soja]
MAEILLRLPVRSVSRFKCVSSVLCTLSLRQIQKELNHRYVCGIAYDSSMDDYVLVIVQFSKHRGQQSWRGFRLEGSLLNGTLHWLLHNDDDNCSKIIAFDVIKRKLSEIPLPFYDFFNLRSKLNLLMAEVWMMKEYKVQSSWTKSLLFSIDPLSHFSPICFTKNGQIFGIGCFWKINET